MTDQVTTLQSLEMLSLDNCALTNMPNLYGMSRLFSVILPNNRLSKLDGLMNVYTLMLYKNLFSEIPVPTEPGTLVRLDMNYNPVKNMDIITSFSNITDVRLSNTDISVVPSTIYELSRLYFLDVSHSKVSHLPKTILNEDKHRYIVIQGNPFPVDEINSIKLEFSMNRPDVTLLI
jgi:Leucine-rich repeat (LRR) protein